MHGLKVFTGKNNLDTCYQYGIKAGIKGARQELLNIKIYDKVLDLVSHQYKWPVGCSADELLGCKKLLDIRNKRICSARFMGVTRVEVSVFPNAVDDYNPF